MINNNIIIRKPYITPLVVFEDVEQDEREMIMGSVTQGGPEEKTEDNPFGAKGTTFVFEEPSSEGMDLEE